MDYLKCVQEDIAAINTKLVNLKKEYDAHVESITKELRALEAEEDKIMKRTNGSVRCTNCNKFGHVKQFEHTVHYRSSEMGGEYECEHY